MDVRFLAGQDEKELKVTEICIRDSQIRAYVRYALYIHLRHIYFEGSLTLSLVSWLICNCPFHFIKKQLTFSFYV